MRRHNTQVVRQPIAVGAHPRRRLEERLSLRFPRILTFVARMVFRLPPRSRLRQALIRRGVQRGFEANNRGDFETTFMLYHPNVEAILRGPYVGLGEEPMYRGREERVAFQRRWHAQWGERYGRLVSRRSALR